MTYDVIILGAGAAGLSCARDLSGAGKRVCILEARDRIGGRIFTRHVRDLPLPIELGAEFIHGEAHTTFAIVEAAALTAYQLPDEHAWVSNGRWTNIASFWDEVQKVTNRIRAHHDISFAEFLKRQKKISGRTRAMAMGFVEGYHAAHADRMSALVLKSSDEEQEEPKQFRIANGYDALVEWLRAGLDPERTSIHLGTPATEVEWRSGQVVVNREFRAEKCVITVPVGVLKAGDIRFTPGLEAKRGALDKIEVGHVVKTIFRFRERFWDDFNFAHSSDRFVPTIWTAAPVRAPILTAWSGGHAADRLMADASPTDRALEAIATALGKTRRQLDRLLDATYMHNWQADPFSRGAYSYAAVGGQRAHATLGKPLSNTLFFAGEATSGDQTATVAGAIESGKRAAKEVLRTGD